MTIRGQFNANSVATVFSGVPQLINPAMIISDLDAKLADATYHWTDYVRDNGVTTAPAYAEVRYHIRKAYGCGDKQNEVDGKIRWIGDYGYFPSSTYELVEQILQNFNITFDFNIIPHGKIDNKQIHNSEQLVTLIQQYLKTYRLNYPATEIRQSLDAFTTTVPENIIADRSKTLAYNPAVDLSVWKAVGDVFDGSKQDTDFVIAILQKFIWQVKRKARGIKVTDHLMPVIFGGQGTGKSYWLTNVLYAPVLDMTLTDQTFSKLTEERNAQQWNYLIHHFDEMAYASQSNVETVKECITSDVRSYRPMQTTKTAFVTNRATMIGATNKMTLDQLIRDDTGARRFAPLYFATTRWDERPKWNVDPILLWQTVNEDGPDPVSGKHLETLKSIQTEQKFKSPYELWFDDLVQNNENGLKEGFSNLWQNFAEWAKETNTYLSKGSNRNAFFQWLDTTIEKKPHWRITKPGNVKTAVYEPNGEEPNVVNIDAKLKELKARSKGGVK